MRKVFANLIMAIVAVIGIFIFYYTIKAYFIIRVGDGFYYDGWGRELYDPPFLFAMIWNDMQYPGLKWFIIDTVGFWITLGVCGVLIHFSNALRESR